MLGVRGLGPRFILRALIDNLAVVHVELVRVHNLPTGYRGDMQVLDAMQVGQRKGKTFSLFGRNKLIDVDRMNRLLTLVIATTVAKRLPTSGETREKNISHDNLPSCYA
jgi:hypothetical protein